MSSPTLPLSDIVNVVVLVSPQAPPTPTFNQGLVIGPSTVIPAAQRVRSYTTLAQMLTDGFTTASPEYLAAAQYFGQLVPPQTLWVGRLDLTSIATWALASGATGAGYQIGDVLTITQGAASGGTITVTAVNGTGAVTAATLTTQGTGYAVATNLATTGGHGTGALVNISAVGDTPLAAVQYCRTANGQWWGVYVTSAVTADHEAIAAYAQAASPTLCYFYTTADAAALSGATGNVFSFMKTNSYNRVFGVYSTTQGGLYPNNAYAGAAAMGVAMGLNTGLASSFFTMKFKTLVGVTFEPLTETQIGVIQGNNGNVVLNYGNAYSFIGQGVVGNGQFFDEILNLDMLTSQIQYNVMNLLVDNPAIPLTDAGETQLIHAVNQACDNARARGFIAGGIWNGVQIVNLNPGDPVPKGYLAQAFPFSTQTTSDRQARKAMPIYVAIIEAGAAHSLLVGVYVQR